MKMSYETILANRQNYKDLVAEFKKTSPNAQRGFRAAAFGLGKYVTGINRNKDRGTPSSAMRVEAPKL